MHRQHSRARASVCMHARQSDLQPAPGARPAARPGENKELNLLGGGRAVGGSSHYRRSTLRIGTACATLRGRRSARHMALRDGDPIVTAATASDCEEHAQNRASHFAHFAGKAGKGATEERERKSHGRRHRTCPPPPDSPPSIHYWWRRARATRAAARALLSEKLSLSLRPNPWAGAARRLARRCTMLHPRGAAMVRRHGARALVRPALAPEIVAARPYRAGPCHGGRTPGRASTRISARASSSPACGCPAAGRPGPTGRHPA
jgi:hypothetical protein